MNETEQYILKQLSSIIDVPKEPKTIAELLNLPAWTIKDVEKKDAVELDDLLNVKTIADLVNVDISQLPSELELSTNKLERWIAAACLASRATKIKVVPGKKILILGLDNAGKTATLELIKHKPTGSLEKLSKTILSLKPTKGASREGLNFHNLEFTIWDMGGQKEYRKKYLEKPDYFFVQTDILYFVLDIQDKNRYDEAMDYLDKVLSIMKFLKETPLVMILFHKFDPDVSDISTDFKEKEVQKFFEKYPDFKYDIYKTSIYNESSIFKAFSDGLKLISSNEKVINGIIREFGTSLGIENLVLVDSHGLEISGHAVDEKTYEYLYNLTMYASSFCINLEKTAALSSTKADKLSFHVLPDDKYLILLQIPINADDFFLGLLHEDEHKVIETQGFSKALLPWLENFFL